MKQVFAMVAAGALALAPQVTMADPVEVTYDDAVKCAALDFMLALSYSSDNASAEDKQTAEYFTGMMEKWTTQAGAANPGGPDAATDDISSRAADLTVKMADAKTDDEISSLIDDDIQLCTQLEESAYGGPNGVVD